MTKNKTFLIVMPVYNEEQIIREAIFDWLKIANKYKGQLLVINDGSKDKTKNIIENIKNKKSDNYKSKKFRSW